MILTQVVFLTSDVDDIEVYLPHPPSKGEIFVFMVCIFVLIVSTLFFKSVIEYAPGF